MTRSAHRRSRPLAGLGRMTVLGLRTSWRGPALVAVIGGIGALIVLYARYYMSSKDPVPRFFCFLLAFMGAMTGVVLSGNIIQLAFFWELTVLFQMTLT